MSEMFAYLGLTSDVHFFMHVCYNAWTTHQMQQMCGQVYNIMIQEAMIQKEQKVVVFNLCTDRLDILPICADHISFTTMQFNPGQLENALKRLTAAPRGPRMMVIKAKIERDEPSLYEMFDIPSVAFPPYDGNSPAMSKLERVISTKEIDYF